MKGYWGKSRYYWRILCDIQNLDTFRTWGIFKSLSELCIQVFLNIKDKDIHAYSHRHTAKGEGGDLSCPFLKIGKSGVILGNKSDFFHLWVKFSIENVVLWVSRRKNSKMFPCGTFSVVFLMKSVSKCPYFHKSSPPLKNFWLRACTQAIFSLPNAIS